MCRFIEGKGNTDDTEDFRKLSIGEATQRIQLNQRLGGVDEIRQMLCPVGYRTTIHNDVIKQNRCIDKVMNTEWQQQLL